jgi:hypothetical protein
MSLPPPLNEHTRRWRKRSVHLELNAAAGACRLLGLLFICLGAFPLLLPQFGFGLRRGPWWLQQVMAVVITLVLVGPGAWYFVAARLTRRADLRAIRISLVVVWVQAALILIGLALAFIARVGEALVLPSFVGLFFLPALGAAAWHLVRARRTAASIERNYGFDLLAPKPAVPLEPMSIPPSAAAAGQPPPLPQWSPSVSVSPAEGPRDDTPR